MTDDSLVAAIQGTERGETWRCARGGRLWKQPQGTTHDCRWVVIAEGEYLGYPPAHGWRRVEEPLICPSCGAIAELIQDDGWYTVICCQCYLEFGGHPFPTAAEAREVWLKIGRAR